jgi:hypothetical protein
MLNDPYVSDAGNTIMTISVDEKSFKLIGSFKKDFDF